MHITIILNCQIVSVIFHKTGPGDNHQQCDDLLELKLLRHYLQSFPIIRLEYKNLNGCVSSENQ